MARGSRRLARWSGTRGARDGARRSALRRSSPDTSTRRPASGEARRRLAPASSHVRSGAGSRILVAVGARRASGRPRSCSTACRFAGGRSPRTSGGSADALDEVAGIAGRVPVALAARCSRRVRRVADRPRRARTAGVAAVGAAVRRGNVRAMGCGDPTRPGATAARLRGADGESHNSTTAAPPDRDAIATSAAKRLRPVDARARGRAAWSAGCAGVGRGRTARRASIPEEAGSTPREGGGAWSRALRAIGFTAPRLGRCLRQRATIEPGERLGAEDALPHARRRRARRTRQRGRTPARRDRRTRRPVRDEDVLAAAAGAGDRARSASRSRHRSRRRPWVTSRRSAAT